MTPLKPQGQHSFAKNLFSSSLGQVITMALAVINTVITARMLGASGRGVLAMVTSAAAVGAGIFSLGTHQAVMVFVARRKMDLLQSLELALAVASAAAIASWFGAGVGSSGLIGIEAAQAYVALGAGLIVMSAFQTSAAAGAGRLDIGAANTVTTAAALLLGYTGIWLLEPDVPSVALVACGVWLAAQAFGDAAGWFALLRTPAGRADSKLPIREFSSYALAASPAAVVAQLSAKADLLLLGVLATNAAVGVYSTAVVAASMLFVMPAAVGAALASPFGCGLPGAGRSARKAALGASVSVLALGPLLAVVLSAVAVPLLGNDFSDVVGAVLIMIPGMVLFASAYPSSVYFSTALARPLLSAAIAGASLVVDLVLLAVIGREYGVYGAAVASSLGYAVGGLINFVLLWRVTRHDCGTGPAQLGALFSEWLRDVHSFVRRRFAR